MVNEQVGIKVLNQPIWKEYKVSIQKSTSVNFVSKHSVIVNIFIKIAAEAILMSTCNIYISYKDSEKISNITIKMITLSWQAYKGKKADNFLFSLVNKLLHSMQILSS